MLPFLFGMAGKAVLGAVIKKSLEKAVDKAAEVRAVPINNKAEEHLVTTELISALEKDPVFINATNSEPWYQSGVAWGQVVVALGVIVPVAAKVIGFDISTEEVVSLGGAIITVAGMIYTLYRRFWPGLKPIGEGK